MKLKINDPLHKEYASLAEYVETCLNRDDYDKRALEAAADTASNNSKAIGKLLDTLADKGILFPEEVVNIIEGWTRYSAEFIK
jgi:hypothetical protein